MSSDASEPALNEPRTPRRFTAPVVIWAVTAALMLVVSLAWAGGKRRHTGDTWIGLAAGKQICEQGYVNFPKADQFTFTFNGKPWINQNWLVHVAYWLLYDKLGNWALVAFKLFLVLVSALLLYRTSDILCQDRAIALFVTCVGMLTATEFIDIRPNHVGILGAATLMWMLMSLKYGKRWPIWWLPVLMLFWGCAHGSFLFGFAVIGMFMVTELFQRLMGMRGVFLDIPTQIRLGISAAVSVVAILIVSPYHFENFTHPLIIIVSKDAKIFQNVMEWKPSYQDIANWMKGEKNPAGMLFYMRPSVEGFFYVLIGSVIVWTAAIVGRLTMRDKRRDDPPSNAPAAFDISEIAIVLVVLYFAITSRRFVFLYLALALPWTAKMISVALRSFLTREPAAVGPFPPGLRAGSRITLSVVNVLGIIFFSFTAYLVYPKGQHFGFYFRDMDVWKSYFTDEWKPLDGDTWFALHTTRNNDLLEILKIADKYGLEGPVFNEWTWGGYLMLHAPRLKLFIDGRSQALFSAPHFIDYWGVIQGVGQDKMTPQAYAAQLDQLFDSVNIDIVILKRRPVESRSIINPLMNSGSWEMITESEYKEGGVLMVRRNSTNPSIQRLLQAFYNVEIDWPDTRLGNRIRGYAIQRSPNPDWNESLKYLQKSLDVWPESWVYSQLVINALNHLGDREATLTYFRNELARLLKLKPRNKEEEYSLQQSVLTLRRIITDLGSAAQNLDPTGADSQ